MEKKKDQQGEPKPPEPGKSEKKPRRRWSREEEVPKPDPLIAKYARVSLYIVLTLLVLAALSWALPKLWKALTKPRPKFRIDRQIPTKMRSRSPIKRKIRLKERLPIRKSFKTSKPLKRRVEKKSGPRLTPRKKLPRRRSKPKAKYILGTDPADE